MKTIRCGSCHLAQYAYLKTREWRKSCLRCKAVFAAILVEDEEEDPLPIAEPVPTICTICKLQDPVLPTMEEMTTHLYAEAVHRTGNAAKGAKLIGVGKTTLYRHMKMKNTLDKTNTA